MDSRGTFELLLGHRAACYGLEQTFKTRQALADLRLASLHDREPITQASDVLPQPGEQPDQEGSDAEKPAEFDGYQHVV